MYFSVVKSCWTTLCRMSVPKDDVPPVCTDMLVIDKASRTLSMENCGESVPLEVCV